MMKKAFLLQSASVAVLSTVAIPALAADPDIWPLEPPHQFPQWYFSVEGGPVFGDSSVRTTDDKLGRLEATNDLGAYGAVALGRQFDPRWDWRVGLAYTRFGNDTARRSVNVSAENVEFSTAQSLTTKLQYATVDFEVGYKPPVGLDNFDVRLFGGLGASGRKIL